MRQHINQKTHTTDPPPEAVRYILEKSDMQKYLHNYWLHHCIISYTNINMKASYAAICARFVLQHGALFLSLDFGSTKEAETQPTLVHWFLSSLAEHLGKGHTHKKNPSETMLTKKKKQTHNHKTPHRPKTTSHFDPVDVFTTFPLCHSTPLRTHKCLFQKNTAHFLTTLGSFTPSSTATVCSEVRDVSPCSPRPALQMDVFGQAGLHVNWSLNKDFRLPLSICHQKSN